MPETRRPVVPPGVPAAPGASPLASKRVGGEPAGAARRPAPDGLPTFASRELFGDATEVRIDHAGVIYRLKRTALGKLILTK